MTTHTIRLLPGKDLKSGLDDLVRHQNWTAACLLTGIGSLNRAAIRFANRESAEILEGPLEIISMGGTLSPDGSHLHLSVSDGTGKVWGGHLMAGSIIFTTAEVVVGILSGWEFSRKMDPATGFRELAARRKAAEE
jgi:predicted DNA-binding protein with PD1-like motif